jgi:predicted NBD/HSP70 family sugar kinase
MGHWMMCSGEQLPEFAEEIAGIEVATAEELFKRYHQGEEAFFPVIERMNKYNATAITQIANLLNPDAVILGGKVVLENSSTIIEGIKNNMGPGLVNPQPDIKVTEFQDDVVLHGLKAICQEKFNHPHIN